VTTPSSGCRLNAANKACLRLYVVKLTTPISASINTAASSFHFLTFKTEN
jgi:hypothetical protein